MSNSLLVGFFSARWVYPIRAFWGCSTSAISARGIIPIRAFMIYSHRGSGILYLSRSGMSQIFAVNGGSVFLEYGMNLKPPSILVQKSVGFLYGNP